MNDNVALPFNWFQIMKFIFLSKSLQHLFPRNYSVVIGCRWCSVTSASFTAPDLIKKKKEICNDLLTIYTKNVILLDSEKDEMFCYLFKDIITC